MKDNIKKMRRPATAWKEVFTESTSKSVIIQNIPRNAKTQEHLILKNGLNTLTDTSPRKIQR